MSGEFFGRKCISVDVDSRGRFSGDRGAGRMETGGNLQGSLGPQASEESAREVVWSHAVWKGWCLHGLSREPS